MLENNDFLLQRTLYEKAPELHKNLNNMIFVTTYAINKAKDGVPVFTDSSIRHSLILIDYLDGLVGADRIDKLNMDEIYILLCSTILHDIGRDPFEGAQFIYKFKDFFEFPTDEHTRAILMLVKGCYDVNAHSTLSATYAADDAYSVDVAADSVDEGDEADVDAAFDFSVYPNEYMLPDGNTVHLWDLILLMKQAVRLANEAENADRSAKDLVRVLDTDMGIDDITAIILTKLMGKNPPDYVIVAPGNTSLDNGVRNLLAIRKLFNIDFDVVRGYDTEQPPSGKESFHGADGFANIGDQFIERLQMTEDELNDYIDMDTFKNVLSRYNEIEYTTIDPLGNLAFLLQDAELNPKFKKIYAMGGGISEFNCPHNTEFNFFKDPGAVKTVFESGKNIVLFPLDLTNRQRLDIDMLYVLATSIIFPEVGTLLEYNYNSNYKLNDIPAAVIHDAMPILYQCNPELFRTEAMMLATDEYGATFVSEDGHPVTVALSVNNGLLFERLKFLLC